MAGKIAVDVHVTLRKVVFCICKINYLTAKSMTFNQAAAGAPGPEVQRAGAATGPGGSSWLSQHSAAPPGGREEELQASQAEPIKASLAGKLVNKRF